MRWTAKLLRSKSALGAVVLLAGCADSVVDTHARVETDLVGLAHAVLNEKNAALVTGRTFSHSPATERVLYIDAIEKDLAERATRRAELVQQGHRYAAFTTTVDVQRTEIGEKEAALRLVEHTVIANDAQNVVGVPATTEYVQEHLFRFVRRQGNWHLLENRLINTPESYAYLAGRDAEPIEITATAGARVQQDSPTMDAATLNDGFAMAKQGEGVSKAAVVSYATKYWKNYNTRYRRFSKDCTNFVSQAMREGGWRDTGGAALYRYVTVWFYDSIFQSWTWVNANDWFAFVNSRPRGRYVKDSKNLVPGDVIQIDFDLNGRIDHTMIVTARDNIGRVYLTYHSNDTYNKPFADIRAQYPRAAYHYWSLN